MSQDADAILKAALAGDKRAVTQLITRTLRQLTHLWVAYSSSVRDDIKQEIALGIMRALRDYDPSRGSFVQYAAIWSRSRISLFMDKNRSLLSGRRQRQVESVVSLDYAREDNVELHDLIADRFAEQPDHQLAVTEALQELEELKPKPRRWVPLDWELVREIRRLRAQRLTIAEISERLHISKSNVWLVASGRIWRE